jgi:hypothetical protein
MATTRTFSATKTFPRIALLKLQVSIALKRTTTLSQSSLDKILKGVDNQWIDRINVFGMDASNKAWCQLTIRIDWARHRIHIAAGRTTVSIGKGWLDDTALELGDSIKLFQDYVAENGLRTYWTINTVSLGNRRDAAFSAMGLKNADPIQWAGPKANVHFNVPELDEMSVDLYLVE